MSYGDRLDQAIRLARSSRAAVATATGVSVQAIGQVIRGETVALTAENSARAAKELRVDHHWLATGEGSPTPKANCPFSQELIEKLNAMSTEDLIRHENAVRAILGMEMITPLMDKRKTA